MESNPIDRVLACPTLPSLPGVALKLLELTRDPNVRLEAIAGTVEHDPALASRVLRTANSSYYGLAKPCPTIGRALGFLGLSTVKSLVLGFSLVDSAKKVDTGGTFDLTIYWRRAIYGAAAARLFAKDSGLCDPEEAFLGTLIQDIGMLAACTALKGQYAQTLAAAGDDHAKLPEAERAALGFDHTQVGRALAERWRLPPQFIECIRHHHTPAEAAPEHAQLVRTVVLGGAAAGVLNAAAPAEKLAALVAQASEWLGWNRVSVEELLKQTAERASEISSLLDVKMGQAPDVAAILSDANAQLAEHQVEFQREASALKQANEHLAKRSITDGLTGVFNRAHFDTDFTRIFAEAASTGGSVGLLIVDVDRFKAVNDTHGHAAGDIVLAELAQRVSTVVASQGTVCRYGGEEFAVILPAMATPDAARLAERIRAAVERPVFDLRRLGGPVAEITVTVSVGVAALCAPTRSMFPGPEAIIQAADTAMYASKRRGRNHVTAHRADGAGVGAASPEEVLAAAPGLVPPASRATDRAVLLVEEDPMAARFFALLCARQGVGVTTASSAQIALAWLAQGSVGPKGRPDLIVCDVGLPDMPGWELITRIRAVPAARATPIAVLTSLNDATARKRCLEAGAAMYIAKADFCAHMSRWLDALTKLLSAEARAA